MSYAQLSSVLSPESYALVADADACIACGDEVCCVTRFGRMCQACYWRALDDDYGDTLETARREYERGLEGIPGPDGVGSW